MGKFIAISFHLGDLFFSFYMCRFVLYNVYRQQKLETNIMDKIFINLTGTNVNKSPCQITFYHLIRTVLDVQVSFHVEQYLCHYHAICTRNAMFEIPQKACGNSPSTEIKQGF